MDINLKTLIGKLNDTTRTAATRAANICVGLGQYEVDIEHLFLALLEQPGSDFVAVARECDISTTGLESDLRNEIARFSTGSARTPVFSKHLPALFEHAWLIASLGIGQPNQIRSGHLLLALLTEPDLAQLSQRASKLFARIPLDRLKHDFDKLTRGSEEAPAVQAAAAPDPSDPVSELEAQAPQKTPALDQFTTCLTQRARDGKVDPVIGRDPEIRQAIDILMRRRQNNPILTGEAGVGKTAVVEGFAQRIAKDDVPPPLKGVTLRSLDIGLLQAGASMKGEFENRLRQVIDEVQASPKPIILFIDEAHTLIGAGGAAGTGDAANLLKPALARGTLRTIAATTFAEYKKYFEKDPALTRRFQVVQVPEPSEAKGILMMRGIASTMEKHHRVQVLDEALEAAVKLSHRYIPARQLPDKAVSLLDTSCARVAISQHGVPAEVEDSRRRIEALDTELEIIAREAQVGIDTKSREADAQEKRAAEVTRLAGLETRWKSEKGLVDRILELRAKLRGAAQPVEGTKSKLEKEAAAAAPRAASPADREALLRELKTLQGELDTLQGDAPLILPTVGEQAVGSVVQDWTGIPVGRMVKNEIETVLKLSDTINQRVVGQKHGLDMIARRIQTSRAALDNPNKPIGVFLLCGPSGVGKTETALALAEALYGGEQNVITINMSEYQEAHTVSTLKGSPPGYVGYGEGGVLTEAVRRRPYSVVLLDEVEKAHPDVHEIFFQVFDKGWMEDGEGRVIDFKNTLILLTSNVGSDLIMNMCKDPELLPDPEGIAKSLREPLLKVFPAALLGRVVTIPYYPLSDAMLGMIIRLQLGRIEKRIREHHKVPFTFGDEVVKLIASRCTELESGGRMVDAILTNTVLPEISNEFLVRMMDGKPVSRVNVSVVDGDFRYAFDA
jgi:type VI secretion system protein VasG